MNKSNECMISVGALAIVKNAIYTCKTRSYVCEACYVGIGTPFIVIDVLSVCIRDVSCADCVAMMLPNGTVTYDTSQNIALSLDDDIN